MEAILAAILSIGGTIVQDAPGVISIVEQGIAAFKAKDQAGIDAAHAAAISLADSLKPAGV
jgi:hypothetical protein